MQTLEQSLADLVVRRVVTADEAITRSSRREELIGLLQRAGVSVVPRFDSGPAAGSRPGGLRVAGG